MPPKRRKPAPAAAPPTRKRPSKLAKENNITAEQEAEIREAFSLFAVQHPEYKEEKEGVLRLEDVRRCLIALDLLPDRSALPSLLEALDPTSTGFATYASFVALCAIQINDRPSPSSSAAQSRGSSAAADVPSAEVTTAYNLFTHNAPGPITISHLRRVARELREDVSDELLRNMILEANGGEGVAKGVGIEEFENVMRRAGVFG